jgi:hypothetical protein
LVPPTGVNVVLLPSHILVVPEIEFEAVGLVVMVTVAEPGAPQQPVLLLYDLK